MYLLVWLENNIRYRSTAYCNPSAIHALKLDEQKNLDKRLVYSFDGIDFVGTKSDKVTYDIYKNWRNFFKELSSEIDNSTILVMAFSSEIRDFINMNNKMKEKNKVKFKDILCLSQAGCIKSGDFNNKQSIAEKLVIMHRILQSREKFSAYSPISELSEEKAKLRLNRSLGVNKHIYSRNFGAIEKQIDRVCSELGFGFIRDRGQFSIYTICGEYIIDAEHRPLKIVRVNSSGNYTELKTKIYSPIDALIEIYRQENNSITKILKKIEVYEEDNAYGISTLVREV